MQLHREQIPVKTPATKQLNQIFTLRKISEFTSNFLRQSYPISPIASKQVSRRGLPMAHDDTHRQWGFWGTCRLIELANGCPRTPAPERPPLSMCVYNTGLVSDLFELMWHLHIMGRGRKGVIEQSKRKKKASGGFSERGMPMTHFFMPNREVKKISIPEQAFEFMKNMNPQQLVHFLLPNDDDWHVKTSSGNASGN